MSALPLVYEKACNRCGNPSVYVTLCTTGPHYAKAICSDCGFFTWMPKPEGDKPKRPASHKDLARKYGTGVCQMCLRTEGELGRGECLMGHHVEEYAKGGDATRENVWVVCTTCHEMVHLLRRACNRKRPTA